MNLYPRRILFTTVFTLLIFSLGGCLNTPFNPFVSPLSFTSPLPADPGQIAVEEYTLEVPEPEAGKGAVRGRLVIANESLQFYLAGQVYLAPLNYMEGDVQVPYISVDTARDPLEDLRNEGEFAFLNVEPGEYGIVVYTPLTSYAIPGEEEGLLIIEVQEGEILDVGDIVLR